MNDDDILIHPLNVKGRYYVEQNICTDHELCVVEAPDNIKMDEAIWCAYVYKQPTTEKEEAQCRAAMAMCPVEAIYDDGESIQAQRD